MPASHGGGPGPVPRQVHVPFLVDEVELLQVLVQIFSFFLPIIIPPLLHSYLLPLVRCKIGDDTACYHSFGP